MIFITLYKLKKKEEEKCSYIVFKKGVLFLGLAEFFISQLPVSSFFFFFSTMKCSCLPWGLMQGFYEGMHSNFQAMLPELAFW